MSPLEGQYFSYGIPYLPMDQYPGKLIAIEGTDGVGRSTQIALLREWLEGLPLWDQLADRAAFRREASTWWRVQPMLEPIRREFPDLDRDDTLRDDGPLGSQLVSHLFRLCHPRKWELCFHCQGTGHGDDPRDACCPTCHGDGFLITKRDWGEPPST